MAKITPLHTFCWGVLHAIGMFDVAKVTGPEKREEPGEPFAVADQTSEEARGCAEEKAWFSIGETVMTGRLAATIATPAGFWFATRTDPVLAFIGATILCLPLFVFLSKVIRQAMMVDTDEALSALGKNEQVKSSGRSSST